MCNEEGILKRIKSLIQEYKAEDKGSPEWIAHLEHSFEREEKYEAGMTKERAKKILDAQDYKPFEMTIYRIRMLDACHSSFVLLRNAIQLFPAVWCQWLHRRINCPL